ncbi:hypothetical protein GCM10023194_81290 [Planotetraspora phitsanulokensis]|uniref:Uncharacterized protein n=1 Tax=Planotetraspora phitsanulokensis TaxID=575192 RepID=A0A8J3XI74_9ACTN|nr:hypothetical protein [Planotetraspora phitsanulokensis]GII42847.1 hypothetical protein Pph01_78500 [Planotetraspora phitsanulokensis]
MSERDDQYDPQHAVHTGKGRYYCDPKTGEMLISVTNTLDQHAIEALAPAAAKVTAEWLMDNLPAAIRAASDPDDLDEFLSEAKGQYRQAWEKKADLGSRVHNIAEAINLGAPYVPDPEAEPFVESYREFLRDFGLDIKRDLKAAECTVLNRTIPYGGTSDIWANLRFPSETSPLIPKYRPRKVAADPLPTPSGLWLIDIKTSLTKPASAIYDDHVMQLAALRHAEVALICPPECRFGETEFHDDSHEFAVPEFVGTAILNLRETTYGFVPVPADKAAFEAFCGLLPLAHYVHGLELRGCKPIQPPIEPPTKTKKRKAA